VHLPLLLLPADRPRRQTRQSVTAVLNPPQCVSEVWTQLETEVQHADLPANTAPELLLQMMALQAEGLPLAQVGARFDCLCVCVCRPRARPCTARSLTYLDSITNHPSHRPPPLPSLYQKGKDPVGRLQEARERR
jgi:hypothetical protein